MDCYKLLLAIGVLVVTMATYCTSDCLEPDTRIIARWKNGNYYKGVVESMTNVISVLFDNGNRLSYNLRNRYDVLEDRIPDESEIKWGDPVVVHRPHSFAYKPAHIREITGGRYMLWYDDGSYIYQTKNDIRVFNKSVVCNEPAYLGCYRDQVPRYLTVFIPTRPATVGACVDMCNAQGYSIAALRNTDLCFCGNAYNKGYQTENDKCDTPCFDNPYEMCGGVKTFSQYWTGIVGDRPAHVPGGLTANTALHMDPYGFRPSYSTAIAKQVIPRYGKLPWQSILQARKRTKSPISLANTSPWRWDSRTKSWLRADGKHFHWDHNKLLESKMGTKRIQTSVMHNGLQWPGKTILSNLKPHYLSNQYSMNNGMVGPLRYNRYPVQGFQQYKAWHTPLRPNHTMSKYATRIFADTFTPQRVLQKLADRMTHVKWTSLGSFLKAYGALPPAPATFRYLGCYADDYQRDLSHSFPVYPLTTRSCILACRARRFSVAGIQASSECYCGNSYSRYGRVREHECNMKCAATRDTCGGVLRNSLYFTGVGSAWPKMPVTKKPASPFSNARDSSVEILSNKSTPPNSHTKIHDNSNHGNKNHGNSNHNKSTSAAKDKKQSLKKPTKLKIKTRNKIISLPASTKHKPDFDDFQVESIKVKLNFSELKKALQTMSPSIVKRIQNDLQKINKLEHQKQLNSNNTTTVKENKKLPGISIPSYKNQIKKIREKIDKVAINRLTAKNMKDILKLIKVPQSAQNIKAGVVSNSDQHIDKKRTTDDNLAHEEIESYAKISLEFPFKMREMDQPSLNRKKELLKILAKHVSASRKDADKKTTKQNTSRPLSQKSFTRAAVSKLRPTTPAFKRMKTTVQSLKSLPKKVKPVTILEKQVKVVKIHDKHVKPVNASDKQVKLGKSVDKQVKPVKTSDKQVKLGKSVDKQVKPVKTSDRQVKPGNKMVKPVTTPGKQVKSVQSYPNKVKPGKSSFAKQVEALVHKFTKQLKPVKSVSKHVNPVTLLAKEVNSLDYKQTKPVKPVAKQVTVLKSLSKQTKPTKSVKHLKSLDNYVKTVKINDSKVKPGKSLDKKVTLAKSPGEPVKQVKTTYKVVKPVTSDDKKTTSLDHKQVKRVKSLDKQVKPTKPSNKQTKHKSLKIPVKSTSKVKTSIIEDKHAAKNVPKPKVNDPKHLKSSLPDKNKKREGMNNVTIKKISSFEDALLGTTEGIARQSLPDRDSQTKNKELKESTSKENQQTSPRTALKGKSESAQHSKGSVNYDKSGTETKKNKKYPTQNNNNNTNPPSKDKNKESFSVNERSNETKKQIPMKNDNETNDTKLTKNETEEDHSGSNDKEKANSKNEGKKVEVVPQSKTTSDEKNNEDQPHENKDEMVLHRTIDTGAADTKSNKEQLQKKEKKEKLVPKPTIASSSDDNGVIVLGDVPDDMSSYDESVANPSQPENEPVSGVSDIPNIDSSDENKLISFQNNDSPDDTTQVDENHIGEDGSGSANSQDTQTPYLPNSTKQVTKQLNMNNDTSVSSETPTTVDDNTGQKANKTEELLDDDKSKYVYFGNDTTREPLRLPLISKEDLKTLLQHRDNATKRSSAVSPQVVNATQSSTHNQNSPGSPESSGDTSAILNHGSRYTRSRIPHSAKAKHSVPKHSEKKKRGLRVVKNGVTFTIDKGQQSKKLSSQKVLNYLRKQSKNLKQISQERDGALKKRILHHISERTNKQKSSIKDSKRDVDDNGNVEHSFHFRDDGAKNELISQGI